MHGMGILLGDLIDGNSLELRLLKGIFKADAVCR